MSTPDRDTCWCGAPATVRNEWTDATPSHPACDRHAKDGYTRLADSGPAATPDTPQVRLPGTCPACSETGFLVRDAVAGVGCNACGEPVAPRPPFGSGPPVLYRGTPGLYTFAGVTPGGMVRLDGVPPYGGSLTARTDDVSYPDGSPVAGSGPDPVTARAEAIRESTGCTWEDACRRAERERDSGPDACDYCPGTATAHAAPCPVPARVAVADAFIDLLAELADSGPDGDTCDGLGTCIGTIPGRDGETGYYPCPGCPACSEDPDGDAADSYPPCPVCGDPIDYCLGHGDLNACEHPGEHPDACGCPDPDGDA